MPTRLVPDKVAFESLVDRSGDCHLWMGPPNNGGYGNFSLRGMKLGAHVAAWWIYVGPVPNGLRVLHKCDVRQCVRIEHLFVGTQGDNIRDMISKGRSKLNHVRHITEDQISEVRFLYEVEGWNQARIAKELEIHDATVSHIVRRKRYAIGCIT